jgi:glycosyltransferase involved in cell wall biosynthesis
MSRIPTVSIVIPVCNGENFLREAITSIVLQSYRDFELVISDNASTDATESICRELSVKDYRIRYIRQPVNIGAARNFNILVAEARGRYFKWMAHDDVIAPNYLAACVEVLERDSTAVLASTRVRYIDSSGNPHEEYASSVRIGDPDPSVRFSEMMRGGGRCYEIFGLIRRSKLLQTGMIGCYYHGDGVLLAHLSLLGRFEELPEILLYLRRHDKQSMYVFGVAYREVAPDFEAYAAWFDPRNHAGVSRSFSKMLADYCWMVRVVPLSLAARASCAGVIAVWLWKRWRFIAGEWKRTLLHALGADLKSRSGLNQDA